MNKTAAAVLLWAFCYGAFAQSDLWYQPSMGRQTSVDYRSMYTANKDFAGRALDRTQVYMISRKLWMTEKDRRFFLLNVVPLLKARGITLAINTTGAVWLNCKTAAAREAVLTSEINIIDGIERVTGLKVSHLALQSVLSKPLPTRGGMVDSTNLPNCRRHTDYNTADRINDVINYVKVVKANTRGIKVGIIDATLSSQASIGLDGETAALNTYAALSRRIESRNSKLDFVLIDHPYDYIGKGSSILKLRRLTNFLKKRAISPGLIVNSAVRTPIIDSQTGKDVSTDVFQHRSRQFMKRVLSAGGGFDFYMQTSFYEPINLDRPQMELLFDFSDMLDRGSYSHYRPCHKKDYVYEVGLQNHPIYGNDPLAHFKLAGKYRGRCAPIL